MFGFFLCTVISSSDGIEYSKPFLTFVSEIAVGDGYIYTLDSTFHNICKYDIEGNFILRITFKSMGSSRIFCDDAGQLCRYSERGQRVYVYDDDGSVQDEYDCDFSELSKAGKLKYSTKTREVVKDGVTYKFTNRWILNSILALGNNSIVVEKWSFHVMTILYMLVGVLSFASAAANLMQAILKMCEDKFNSFSSGL